MMRFLRIGALCAVACMALQASAMPLGYRLSRQARAAVRQAKPAALVVGEEVFGDLGDVSLDGNDNIVVTLTGDVSGTVEIPDNVGAVTIDLNGHDLVGDDGRDGARPSQDAGEDGKPAIRIVKGDGEGEPTEITIVNSGGDAAVRGGEGGAGNPCGEDTPAIEVADGTQDGVLINIGEGVAVQGGGDDVPAVIGKIGENSGTVVKATYDMSGARWDYARAFEYDGKVKTVLVSGLPSGVTVASYSGNAAAKPGTYTAHVEFAYDAQNYNEPTLGGLKWVIKSPYKLTLTPNSTTRGSVSGGGTYKIGATATLKAAAKTGNAFAGWFTDKACTKPLNPKGYDNRSPTVKVVVLENDTTIYAKFVTAAEAKKSLKFSSATAKLAKTPAKATAGKKFSLKLGISSASLVTVTATGLPKGLKIDKTTGAITGTATVVGDFTATVTVKDAAGNKITQKVKITARTASYAKGTFYGTAKPDGKTLSYLKFTVAATGKVSGKVTYKGKAYSFTSAYKSCTATKATFASSVKVGKKTFKPGTVTVKTQKLADLSLVEAANSKGTFATQKKANLVKKGKALAKLVGKTFTFTKKTKNSGLTKSKDKLEVKLANGDAAKVTGVVGGKKLTAISWVTLVSGKATKGGSEVYTLYVDIIDAKLKYEKTLVITATVGSGGVKATAAFAK